MIIPSRVTVEVAAAALGVVAAAAVTVVPVTVPIAVAVPAVVVVSVVVVCVFVGPMLRPGCFDFSSSRPRVGHVASSGVPLSTYGESWIWSD